MTEQEMKLADKIPSDERPAWLEQIRHDLKHCDDVNEAFKIRAHHNDLAKHWGMNQMVFYA